MMSRILPILIVLGAVGLFLGYTQPTFTGSVATMRAEIADLDTALVAARTFKEKESDLARQKALIPQEQLDRVQAFLPDNVDNVQLIVDLNALAARSGVSLSEFSIVGGDTGTGPVAVEPAPALSSGEPTESLELSVSATGSYAAFRTFLDGVEKSLRPLDVVELSVQDSATGVYTYAVTFRLYWLQ